MSLRELYTDVSRSSDKESCEHLVTMHPVASGDNFALVLRSTHRLKDDVPALVPCCEGRELHHRNSFRSLHRPDLRRVPCLRKMAPQELESLFRGCTAPVPKPDVPTSPPAPDVASEPQGEEFVRLMLPSQDEPPTKIKRCRDEPAVKPINGRVLESANAAGSLRPIREPVGGPAAAGCGACGSTASAELPSGMRLHGARARLYTSVLGGAHPRAPGDQLDVVSTTGSELDERAEQAAPVDTMRGELHTILPPRRDDPSDDCSTTASSIC